MSESEDKDLVDLRAILDRFVIYLRRVRSAYLLFFVIFCALMLFFVALYKFATPSYTATAIIGPPNPSPVNTMLLSMGGGSVSSAMKRITGGSSSSNDPFQEYQQLMGSPQLNVELANTPDFMHMLFYKQWDAENKRWRGVGGIGSVIISVKRFLNRHVSKYPDAVALHKILAKKLSISKSEGVSSGAVAQLAALTGSYLDVSFKASSPSAAEAMLNTILDKADGIVRRAQLRDVEARIAYIHREMEHISQTEQRESLIQILTAQEELKVMMIADKRFSYVMVSAPYASPVATSPMKPTKAVFMSIFVSLLLLAILVALEEKSARIKRILEVFRRRTANKDIGKDK